MASRILLVNANRCTNPDPVFPLGLAHLSAALRQAGHTCAWLDSLAHADQFEARLAQSQADFVGLSVRNIDDVLIRKQETFFGDLASLGAAIRRRLHGPVIVGGSGFSIFPQPLLNLAGGDFGIIGEGESSLVALIGALERGGDYRGIPGLVFREGAKIVVNPPGQNAPRWELNEEDWPPSVTAHYLQRGSMLNLQTQRGCACHCVYCTYPVIEGRRQRQRPAEIVAREFERLQRLGARYVFIVDSVFNSAPGHVIGICEALLRRGVKVPWGCFLRPQGLTPDLLRLMARAGLAHIEFGTDSFCDDVLGAYQKGFTFEEVLHSSEMARAENIDFCHYLIAGGPGETHETLQRGFEMSQKLVGAVILAVVGMRLYPGTHLYERAVAEGRTAPETDLLPPAYYLAPGLTPDAVFAQLQEFARRSPNWIVGDPGPAFRKLVDRLRQRGVTGPLWNYFSLLQRLGLSAPAAISKTNLVP